MTGRPITAGSDRDVFTPADRVDLRRLLDLAEKHRRAITRAEKRIAEHTRGLEVLRPKVDEIIDRSQRRLRDRSA